MEEYTGRDLDKFPGGRAIRGVVTRDMRVDSSELSDEKPALTQANYENPEVDYEYGMAERFADISGHHLREKPDYEPGDGFKEIESGMDDKDGLQSGNAVVDINRKRGYDKICDNGVQNGGNGGNLHGNYNGMEDYRVGMEGVEIARGKHDGPDVIVTAADVHLSADEIDEIDNVEYQSDYFEGGFRDDDTEVREGRNRRVDKQQEMEGSIMNKKYQSHQNLSQHGENEEDRKRSRSNTQRSGSLHTPYLVRRGSAYNYEIEIGEHLEENQRDLRESVNCRRGDGTRSGSAVQKTTSMVDMSHSELTMPQNKMGSYNDFKPLKHSPSTARVSSSKGRFEL